MDLGDNGLGDNEHWEATLFMIGNIKIEIPIIGFLKDAALQTQ